MIDLEAIEREIDKLEHLAVPFRHVFKLISVSLLLVTLEAILYRSEGKTRLACSLNGGAVTSDLNTIFKLYAWLSLFCRSTFVGQSHRAIVDVVLMSTPLKIVGSIVDLAFIPVVDLIESVWIRTKCSSYKTVYSIRFPHAAAVENYVLVASRFIKRQTHYFPRPQAFHTSKVGNLVQTFVSSNVFPMFHHAPI